MIWVSHSALGKPKQITAIPEVNTVSCVNSENLKEIEYVADDTLMKEKDSYAGKVSGWKAVARVGGKLKPVQKG